MTLPGLEAGATYEVQVRAIAGVEGEGPWSDTGEGAANRPPTASNVSFTGGTLAMGGDFAWHEEAPLGSGAFFTDPDGDALTYSASAEHPALLGVGVTGAAGSAVLTANLLNQGASKVNYTASDPYGGAVTRTVTITITAKESREVAENSAAGTNVGAPVTGTPYNGVALSYTLTGNAADSGKFAIDSATGQISVAQGATLDYETDNSYRETETWNGQVIARFYRGKVNYTVDGNASAIDVIIKVTDVETGKPDAPTLARTTSSVPMDPALDVTWTALAANGLTTSGYNVQYRKKAAEGEEAVAWTDYTLTDANDQPTTTIPAASTSVTIASLDAGATYQVQLRAVTSEEAEGPWSDIGERTANRPPTASSVALADATITWKHPTSYALGDKFEDADGDELSYSASAAQAGVLTVAVTGDDSNVLTVTPLNPAASVVTYTAGDPYGGRASRTVTITGQAGEFRSVAENSAAGTEVGDPVTGTRHGTTALVYSLSGDAATYFDIDSATGQITVKQGTTLDHETTSSYTGKVHWTVQGQAAFASLTINVTDVGAGKTGTPTLTRTRFSEPSAPALDVSWTAPAASGLTVTGYEVEYRKQAAAGDDPAAWTRYTYTDSNGDTVGHLSATTTTLNLAGLEPGATYEVHVRVLVKDDDPGAWSDIGFGRANSPPAAGAVALPDDTLAWKSSASYGLADKFHDADRDTLTYSASAAHPGVLTAAITGDGSDTLTVTSVNPAASVVTYTAADAYGGRFSRTVTITGQHSETRSIAENSPAGTALGDPVTGTPHGTSALTHSLTGDAATVFTIDSATGQISVKQGAPIDYETKTSYTGEVEWIVQGQQATVGLTVNVTDAAVPETPAAPTAEPGTSEPAGSLDVEWTAPDDGGSAITGYRVRYRTTGPTEWTEHTFSGTATNTTIESLEAATVYEVQVLAVNGEGESGWSDSGTGVTGPVQLTAQRDVYENAPAGAPVGEPVQASDPEGRALTYVLALELTEAEPGGEGQSQQDGTFVVDATTGQISLAPGATLDYETADRHYLTVRVTRVANDLADGHVVNAVISVTIDVIDVQELLLSVTPPVSPPPSGAPPALELDSAIRAVAENAPGGTRVGAPVVARGGNGALLTYSLSGSGAFTIDSATGQVRVAAGAVLDHERTQSHTVTVTATGGGGDATADVTITVTDVDEPPARPAPPAVDASPAAPRTALDVTWTAPANTGPPITDYDVRYRKQGEQRWTEQPFTGAATSTTIHGLEPGATYEVQVAASNDEGTSSWSDSGTGATTPDKDRASIQLSAAREVVENAPAGTAVGAPIAIEGGDGESLAYSLSGSGAFTIDSATGQIRVAAGTVLDYESTQLYSVTVSATGGENPDAEVTVTIRVTDVDEAPPRPDAPSVTRSSSAPESKLDVAWSEPDMTGRPPVTSYDIAYREADGGDWTERRLDGSHTSTTIAGLLADVTYHVRIRASNDEGVSPWSDPGTGSTAPQTRAPDTDTPTTPDEPDAPDAPDQPDDPDGPDQPQTPDGPQPPLGPGGPVTPGPGEPGGPLGPSGPVGPGAPTTPDSDGQPTPSIGTSGEGSRTGTVSPPAAAARQSVAAEAASSSVPAAGPVAAIARTMSENRAAAVAGGAVLLVAVLAGLQALLVGLTKPLGLGLPFLIPLLVPARRRRKKRSDDEAPDMTPPASMPEHPLARSRMDGPWHGGADPGHRHRIGSRTVRRFVRGSRNRK